MERAREVVLRLSPDRLCLGGLLDLRGAVPDVVRGVIGAIANALLGGALVKIVSAGIEALTGRSLRQLLVRWGVVKNEAVECIRDIVNSAREASRYIDDEGLSDVVEEVAKKWGWDVDTFKRFVKAAGKTVTESEVRKMIEEALEKIEEELDKVRESVSGLLVGVEVFFINDFEYGLAYPTVRLVDGELMVLGEYGYHEIVRTSSFGALASEVGRRLGAGSLVVLTGPKGVGKSTLATVTTWELLRIGEAGMVLRIRELPDGEVVERFRSFIENFLVRDWEYFGNMVILYDPTGVYGQIGGVEAPSKLETTVRNVLEAVMKAVENAKSILGREPSARVGVLIILPTDLYNALSNDVKDKLESYRLDAPLNDVEFLAKLIMEYTRTSDKPSGCKISDEELSKLAGKVAEFDSGHALIARLTGEELVRNNCNVGEVEELINNAKGKAETFITQYINKLFKVHEDPKTAEALIEVFALRRPFVNKLRPGDPILTLGIVELVGEERRASLLYSAVGEELRSWLAHRQHDLIEDSIEELLRCVVNDSEECKKLGDALKPWRLGTVRESLKKISEEVVDVGSAVKYFANNYGEKLTDALRIFGDCWRRAALIIGAALAGYGSVPRPEDLPKDLLEDAKYLSDALGECDVDEYLLVGNEIPPLIQRLIKNHVHVLTKAFIDKYDRYDDIVNEVNNVFKNARDRGGISTAESVYDLGLASIIANAARSDKLNKAIKLSDADVALRIASFAMEIIILADYVKPILHALKPLRDYTPQRYLGLLASALEIGNLDRDTVRYIFYELNGILDNYGDVVKGRAWSLVHAIIAYANLLGKHRSYFNNEEIEIVVSRIADLLNELGKFKTSLGFIAWAYALAPALRYEDVRVLMEEALRIKVVGKASEVLEGLSRLRGLIQKLMSDKEFMDYVESLFVKADEEAVKIGIIDISSYLKHALAIYRFNNDELREAAELFNKAIGGYREISNYENYLANRSLALRVKAIEGSLVGDKLVDGFRQLYEETFNKEYFKSTAQYLSTASGILGDYLVSLALMGSDESVKRIKELLEEHWWVLNADYEVSVLTRLMLNALLGSRVGLSDELKGKLNVDPKELIVAFEYGMVSEFLPALMVAFDVIKPEDGIKLCEGFIGDDCIDSVLAVKGNSAAIEKLRDRLIDTFRERISEEKRLNLLKGLGVNVDKLFNEFRGLVNGPDSNELDGKSLVQLIAPRTSTALLALMLCALVNGDERLAKAHALYGAVNVGEKLLTRLFLEAYRACCDLKNESFRRAIAKLFFLHV